MKVKVITIAVLAMLFVGCNSTPKNNAKEQVVEEIRVETIAAENTLISNNSVGDFAIGNAIDAGNYTLTEASITLTDEGEEWTETVYNISDNNIELMVLKPEYDFEVGDFTNNIGEIIVISDKFKTAEGIGVNATISQFTSKYPNYKIWYSYIGGDKFVIANPDLDAQFLLDEKDYNGKIQVTGEETPLNISDFNPNAKIVKVIVL